MAVHSNLASLLAMQGGGASPPIGMLPGGQLAQYLAKMRTQPGGMPMAGGVMPGMMPGVMPPQGLGSLQGVMPR